MGVDNRGYPTLRACIVRHALGTFVGAALTLSFAESLPAMASKDLDGAIEVEPLVTVVRRQQVRAQRGRSE